MRNQKSRSNGMKAAIIILSILLLLVIIATCFLFINDGSFENISDLLEGRQEYMEGASVQGVAIGGLTYQEALEYVTSTTKAPTLGMLTVTNGILTEQIDASMIEGVYDFEGMLTQAMAASKQQRGNDEANFDAASLKIFSGPKYDIAPLRPNVELAAKALEIPAKDASVVFLRASDLVPQQEAEAPQTNEQAPVSQTINGVAGAFEYTDSAEGKRVDPIKLMECLQQSIDEGTYTKPIAAPVETVLPSVTLEQIKASFSLVSLAESSFAKGSYSKTNRVFNINKAANIINGYVLQPGEEFSFNKVLGNRTLSAGWRSAGAINDGISVEEVGGGICQVSSTTYNAVLKADLEIVLRIPHSYPLSYLPTGQDATISTGGPDFIFKNNRTAPIVIGANCDTEGKKLMISVYGAPIPDSMTIELESKRIATYEQPADEYVVDPTVAPGTTKQIRNGRSGSRWETYKNYMKDGMLVKSELSHTSYYRPMSEQIGIPPTPIDTIDPYGNSVDPPIENGYVIPDEEF